VPIFEGRDLASDELWDLSRALSRAKREVAIDPPRLPKARRASVSLILAAVAAATPALASAHSRTSKASESTEVLERSTLKRGDRGPAVERLQRALGITADGIFGRQTLKAVRAFQQRAGLVADGIVGPLTRAALERGAAADANGGSTLERGDRGPAVERLQRALGITADGIFGRQTLKAVRVFQQRASLAVDGIVGPRTLSALASASGAAGRESEHSHEPAADTATPSGIDGRLGGALALARDMGLKLISAHRPGAIIESSGQPSDHGVFPSKAIDVSGTPAEMERYARKVAGMKSVDTVIYSGVGIWTAGSGWHEIRTSVTYDSHLDHVHVDTF